MDFHKYHHPANFRFSPLTGPGTRFQDDVAGFGIRVADLGEGVFRLRVEDGPWTRQHSIAALDERFAHEACGDLIFTETGRLRLLDDRGEILLESLTDSPFGVCGRAWMLRLRPEPEMQFYGMGEKCLGFELSGVRTKFWNTDVWADFHRCEYVDGQPDPMYISVPWLVVKRGNRYAGILVHSPFAAFMATHTPNLGPAVENAETPGETQLHVGSSDGAPELYFIVGPSLAALTRKFQRLVGPTPLPPLWALGHHQCRWGYASHHDLDAIDRGFTGHGIPNDGLWLDIDYMDGFRVFTIDKAHFHDAVGQIDELRRRGRHVVPILDPGVKVDDRYDVDREGLERGLFCLNSNGDPYVGFVWPGATHFPDFSLAETRDWWAERVARFCAEHVSGVWIDMNDPSTGAAELSEMRFNRGADPHETFHNQYGLGMAIATRDGLLRAQPDRRPFVLTRSGFIGVARYAAAWTGDNCSSERHLRRWIATSLNLALSGVPFNGADVPGFGLDATPALAVAWYKSAFLSPFLRNHSHTDTRLQEPWTFGDRATEVIGHYIRLRYKLLPYLYNLFIDQEECGAAIMRPLFHDFEDSPDLPLGTIDDQFMLGAALMHAPLLALGASERSVALPAARWFDLRNGEWVEGGRMRTVRVDDQSTPLFAREGAIVPMRPGMSGDNRTDLAEVEFHVFVSRKSTSVAACDYRFDDGETFAYRRGERSEITLRCSVEGGLLRIDVPNESLGAGPCAARFVVYDDFESIALSRRGETRPLDLTRARWRCAGAELPVRMTRVVSFNQ